MNFALTDEQQALRQSARDFLVKECPTSLVRDLQKHAATGHSNDLWQKMADLGWLGLIIPEKYGGLGASLVDLAVLFEQAGRALAPTTLYSTVAGGLVVLNCGSERHKRALLPKVCSGELLLSLAFSEPHATLDPDFMQTHAKPVGNGYVLDGTKMFVPNGHIANYFLIAARTGVGRRHDAMTVFVIGRESPGLTLRSMRTFGKDRQSEVRLDGVFVQPDDVLGEVGGAWPALELAIGQAAALQCVEMVGGAQLMLDVTVEYLKQRIQFDRPIGSFQAAQHHAANMATAVDCARLAAYQAVCRLSKGNLARREVAMAKAIAGDTYKRVSLMSHQLHAGIGYTLEYDLHLWSERAKATELSFGNYDHHLETVANEIGL